MNTEHQKPEAGGSPVDCQLRPLAWAIFVDSGNARMWSTLQPHVQKLADAEGLEVTPLYGQAALDALAAERAESARLRHLLNLARDDYNTAAQRLQDIGDYAHDHSTGPAVPDALWEVRSMAYGSGA